MELSGALWDSLELSGKRQGHRPFWRDNGRLKARVNMANANTTTAEKFVHVIGSKGTGISWLIACKQQQLDSRCSLRKTWLHPSRRFCILFLTFLRVRLMHLWLAAWAPPDASPAIHSGLSRVPLGFSAAGRPQSGSLARCLWARKVGASGLPLTARVRESIPVSLRTLLFSCGLSTARCVHCCCWPGARSADSSASAPWILSYLLNRLSPAFNDVRFASNTTPPGFHREDDGAMDWDTLLHMLCRDCEGVPRWTNPEWLDLLHRGSDKKRFQHCLNSDDVIHYMRAIQSHTGGNTVDPLLLDNLQIPHRRNEYFYHVDWHEEEYQDVSKSRMVVQYKTKWKVFHDAIYWINLRKVQDEGFEFWQTRSNATILYVPVPADCVEKVVYTKTNEILYQKVSLSPRPTPKITLKDTWQVQRWDPLRTRKDGAEDWLQNPMCSTSCSRERRRANTWIKKVSAFSQKTSKPSRSVIQLCSLVTLNANVFKGERKIILLRYM